MKYFPLEFNFLSPLTNICSTIRSSDHTQIYIIRLMRTLNWKIYVKEYVKFNLLLIVTLIVLY